MPRQSVRHREDRRAGRDAGPRPRDVADAARLQRALGRVLREAPKLLGVHGREQLAEPAEELRRRGAFYLITLVPVRPRSRGKRRSLRNLLPGVRLSPPITPRFQSRHTATPFNFNRRLSTPPRRSSARIERERDGIRGGGRGAAAERVETRRRRVVAEAAEVARRRARASPVTERERDRPRG